MEPTSNAPTPDLARLYEQIVASAHTDADVPVTPDGDGGPASTPPPRSGAFVPLAWLSAVLLVTGAGALLPFVPGLFSDEDLESMVSTVILFLLAPVLLAPGFVVGIVALVCRSRAASSQGPVGAAPRG